MALVHLMQSCADALEGAKRPFPRSDTLEQALRYGDDHARVQTVTGGVADCEQRSSAVAHPHVDVVTTDLGGGDHAEGRLETLDFRRGVRQHRQLKTAGVLQLAAAAGILGFEHLVLGLRQRRLAFLRHGVLGKLLHLDQTSLQLAGGSGRAQGDEKRERDPENHGRDIGEKAQVDCPAGEVRCRGDHRYGGQRNEGHRDDPDVGFATAYGGDRYPEHFDEAEQEEDLRQRVRSEGFPRPHPCDERDAGRSQYPGRPGRPAAYDHVHQYQPEENRKHADGDDRPVQSESGDQVGSERECDLEPFQRGDRRGKSGEEQVLAGGWKEEEQQKVEHSQRRKGAPEGGRSIHDDHSPPLIGVGGRLDAAHVHRKTAHCADVEVASAVGVTDRQ